uniref:Disease resistance protein At4g27220 family n=1 Tax=Cajanus cajan TaxID=3821 RepID=A0A151QU47_CAJCA|nr:putative disease resistance protein At4g27220 family [Cajanus cajan]
MTKTTHRGFVAGERGVSGSSHVLEQLNELVCDLTREEEDIKGQLQWLESRGKKPKSQVDHWLNKLQDLKTRADHSMQQLGSMEIQDLIIEKACHMRKKPLVVSNEFVGEDFEENVDKIWKLLGDDEVLIIGIHGMGGVGKTFLATYMENEIKRKKSFKHVFWVTVSHDFTIFKLQHRIAETMGLKLYRDDERSRATILASELEKIEKSVLILDDVWKYIDLEKVGIPLKMNGIKLIITSRLKHVCQQMDCLQKDMITVYPLDVIDEKDLDWKLFLLKLGHHGIPATLSPKVEEVARSVVKKCDGLPVAISVMARSMKEQDDIHWWKHALNKVENFEMGEEVKTVLKRSYDNLNDKDLQKCFLYCALLPYDNKGNWVQKLVERGLLNGKRSFEEMIYEGNVMVDKLINHSLLLWDGWGPRMHDLVKNMACDIMKYMVKINKKLKKIPDMGEWRDDLEAVSLVWNKIEEIQEGASPECPRLSTLILSHNPIAHISDSFFTRMNALTVLDLSNNTKLISLPNSLSNLRSLISLVLEKCPKLKNIPPLEKLQALSTLVISCCSIDQVPQGLENLINLKWLDLSQNRLIPLPVAAEGVLSHLTNLQLLDLCGWSIIKVEDAKEMTMLECFRGEFLDRDNYNHYVQQILNNGYRPKTYDIYFGMHNYYLYKRGIFQEFNLRSLWFADCTEKPYLLPRDLVELTVCHNYQWKYLCAALSSKDPPSFKNISIKTCTKLKRLFCLSNACSACTCIQTTPFHMLTPQTRTEVFRHLLHFKISYCDKIETLLTSELVPSLTKLVTIQVENCISLKEIFAGGGSIRLPKLTALTLRNLPQLQTVCNGDLFCASLDALNQADCPNLRLPKIKLV